MVFSQALISWALVPIAVNTDSIPQGIALGTRSHGEEKGFKGSFHGIS